MKNLPRSLVSSGRTQNRKSATAAKRRKTLAENMVNMRNEPTMQRRRKIGALYDLFFSGHLGSPIEVIEQKIRTRGKCAVFEIGRGRGRILRSLLHHPKLSPLREKIVVNGIDIVPAPRFSAKAGKMMTGDALSKPFPKSDVIFSIYSLGYIGNIGFMVRKATNALNPEGVAVLHINRSKSYGNDLIKDPERLARNLEKMALPECTIRVARKMFLGEVILDDDLVVTIQKK